MRVQTTGKFVVERGTVAGFTPSIPLGMLGLRVKDEGAIAQGWLIPRV